MDQNGCVCRLLPRPTWAFPVTERVNDFDTAGYDIYACFSSHGFSAVRSDCQSAGAEGAVRAFPGSCGIVGRVVGGIHGGTSQHAEEADPKA